MSIKLCTFFCTMVLAFCAINTNIPDIKPQTKSIFDNYKYKTQQQPQRRLAEAKWHSGNQSCYLYTMSLDFVRLNSIEYEKNCKQFIDYHIDYYWDVATSSCMNYYYGDIDYYYSKNFNKKEKTYIDNFRCKAGYGAFVAVIVVPILGGMGCFCVCLLCRLKYGNCACEFCD